MLISSISVGTLYILKFNKIRILDSGLELKTKWSGVKLGVKLLGRIFLFWA